MGVAACLHCLVTCLHVMQGSLLLRTKLQGLAPIMRAGLLPSLLNNLPYSVGLAPRLGGQDIMLLDLSTKYDGSIAAKQQAFWILELGPSRFVTAAPRGGLGSRQPFKPAGAAPPQSPDAEGSANAQGTGEIMERWGLPPAVHWLAGTEGSASLGDRRGLSNLGCS